MKFVVLESGMIVNFDDVSTVDNALDCGFFYSQITMKNGDKINFMEDIHVFSDEDLENGKIFEFDYFCCQKMTQIFLNEIINHFARSTQMFNYEDYEEYIWKKFIQWAKHHRSLIKK